MSIPFKTASYQTQVARLKSLAEEALKLFPVKPQALEFINHGENTTFKLIDKSKKKYLVRVHRAIYHSKPAIEEELSWLHHLAETSIVAPSPILSKNGNFIETINDERVDHARNVDLMNWVEGRFVWKNARPVHFRKIGKLLAELQLDTRKRKTKHRRYWDAEGLVGRDAKLGTIYGIDGLEKKERSILESAAKDILKELKRFETKHPTRMGLIHADLHFGNMVFRPSGDVAPIDFDDCGFGFHMYDLAVPLLSILALKDLKPDTDTQAMREALLAGYQTVKSIDDEDLEILKRLEVARRIAMVGWMSSRSDNPRLRARLRSVIERTLKTIKEQ